MTRQVQLYGCEVCKREVLSKELRYPYGCAYCMCANCGETLGDGAGHVDIKDPNFYICEKSRAPF